MKHIKSLVFKPAGTPLLWRGGGGSWIGIILLFALPLHAQVGDLPRTCPEAVGIPSRAVSRLMDSLMALPRANMHSLVVMRHGKVAYECYPAPFKAESMHTMYSCSKTFVAAAVGIAIDEGRLRLDSRVADFFPMSHPDSVNLRAMTVRHLLTMSSGIEPDWGFRNTETQWTRCWLSKPIGQPGRLFKYDSMCTYLLSAILQKATGQSTLDYLTARLFQPLHITQVEWEESPEGVDTGGWGLRIQAESLAKFGQLLLQGGRWQGRQLIPEAWVKAMMGKQMDNGGAGYGYQMWRCKHPGAARADGAYGQYILVVPDKQMVVVMTQCSAVDGARQRDLVWRRLLPYVTDGELPSPSASEERRHRKHARTMQLPLPQGQSRPPHETPFRQDRPLPPNDCGWQQLEIHQDASNRLTLSYVQDGRRVALPMIYGRWNTVSTPVTPVYSIGAQGRFRVIRGPFALSGGYAFRPDGTLHIRLHYTDWMTVVDLLVPSEPDGKVEIKVNEK